MPSVDDLYSSYLGASDGASARLFARAHVVPALGASREQPILELGAGTGDMVRTLIEFGFRNVHGVDASASQVERARESGIAVELSDGRAALEARASRSLGAVIALDVLEHLETAERLAWCRVAADRLRDDGVLIARAPNGEGLFGGAVRYGDLTHLCAMTQDSARQLMRLAGFQEVRVSPSRPPAHGLASGMRALLWRGIELMVRIADAAESGRFDGIFTRNLVIVARQPRRESETKV